MLDLSKLKPYSDYRIFKDGILVELEDIKKYDVLSVMKSSNGKYEIIVSSKNIRGVVNKLTEHNELSINDITYSCVRVIWEKMEFNVGDAGIFYLNYRGKIAGVTRQTASNIGILINAKSGNNTLDSFKIRVLSQDGNVVDLQLANSVTITYANGQTEKVRAQSEYLIGPGKLWDASNTNKHWSLIRYETNGKGYVTEIAEALANGSLYDRYSGQYVNPDGSNPIEIADSRNMGYAGKSTFRFKVSSYSFGVPEVGVNLFYASDDTIVFFVPFDGPSNDIKDYSVEDMSALRDGGNYDMVAYAIDDSIAARYLVIREKPPLIPSMHASSVPLLITGFGETINEEGERKIVMHALRDGAKVSYILKDERVISKRIIPKEPNGSPYYRATTARGGNYDIGFAISTEIGLATTVFDATSYALYDERNSSSPYYNTVYLPKLHAGITKNRVLPGDVVHVAFDPRTNEVVSMTVTFDGSRPRTAINEKTGIKMDYQAKGLFFIDAYWDSDQSLGFDAGNQRIFGKVVSKRGNYIVLETNYSLRRQQVTYVPYDVSGAAMVYCKVKSTPAEKYSYRESLDENAPYITVNGGTLSHLIRQAEGPGNNEQTTPVEDFVYTTTVVGSSSVDISKKITIDDINIGDEVFIRQLGGDVKNVIVYEWR